MDRREGRKPGRRLRRPRPRRARAGAGPARALHKHAEARRLGEPEGPAARLPRDGARRQGGLGRERRPEARVRPRRHRRRRSFPRPGGARRVHGRPCRQGVGVLRQGVGRLLGHEQLRQDRAGRVAKEPESQHGRVPGVRREPEEGLRQDRPGGRLRGVPQGRLRGRVRAVGQGHGRHGRQDLRADRRDRRPVQRGRVRRAAVCDRAVPGDQPRRRADAGDHEGDGREAGRARRVHGRRRPLGGRGRRVLPPRLRGGGRVACAWHRRRHEVAGRLHRRRGLGVRPRRRSRHGVCVCRRIGSAPGRGGPGRRPDGQQLQHPGGAERDHQRDGEDRGGRPRHRQRDQRHAAADAAGDGRCDVIYDGNDLSAVLTVEDVSRPVMPPVSGGALEPLEIKVIVRLSAPAVGHREQKAALEAKRRMAATALYRDGPRPLVLPDAPDVRLMAELSGATDLERVGYTASAELTFRCEDPVAYGATRKKAVDGSGTLNVGGNWPTRPRVSVYAGSPSATVAVDGKALRLTGIPDGEGPVLVDCGAETATKGGEDVAVSILSDFFELSPGRHAATCTAPAEFEWEERWL
ncbi:hypothetical protein GMI70_02825 [Eggerthellaceae bacterium zg-893]|nr:hypothetical protein [Eggerthellaceae bacterium zg-893]